MKLNKSDYIKKRVAMGLACLTFGVVALSACSDYDHPRFTTDYKVEEHIARIEARTREKYAEEIESGYIQDFTVDIVYAYYDNDPEYFLIEFSLLEELEDKEGNTLQWEHSAHMIGYIYQDKYWTGLYGYKESVTGTGVGENRVGIVQRFSAWIETPSVWKAVGLENEKKYFGRSQYGVRTEYGILSLGVKDFFLHRESYEYGTYIHECIMFSKGRDERFNTPFPAGYEPLVYRDWGNKDMTGIESYESSYQVMTDEDLEEYVNGEIAKNKIFTAEEEKANMEGNFMRGKREY